GAAQTGPLSIPGALREIRAKSATFFDHLHCQVKNGEKRFRQWGFALCARCAQDRERLAQLKRSPICRRISSSAFILPIVSARVSGGAALSSTTRAKSSASSAYRS